MKTQRQEGIYRLKQPKKLPADFKKRLKLACTLVYNKGNHTGPTLDDPTTALLFTEEVIQLYKVLQQTHDTLAQAIENGWPESPLGHHGINPESAGEHPPSLQSCP